MRSLAPENKATPIAVSPHTHTHTHTRPYVHLQLNKGYGCGAELPFEHNVPLKLEQYHNISVSEIYSLPFLTIFSGI